MTGRNDPCPCGSGRKFKKCCALLTAVPSSSATSSTTHFKFTPGTYGGPSAYCPSIACHKQTGPEKCEYHFVLAKPGEVHDDEDSACLSAENDLENAFRTKGESGSDFELAGFLKRAGYLNVEDYKIIKGQETKNG